MPQKFPLPIGVKQNKTPGNLNQHSDNKLLYIKKGKPVPCTERIISLQLEQQKSNKTVQSNVSIFQ